MNIIFILLFIIPLLGSIIGYFLSKKFPKIRNYLFIGLCSLEMLLVIILDILFINLGTLSININYIMGLGLSFEVDEFRSIYATISIFMWLITTIFSKEYMKEYHNKERYYFFNLLTLLGVVGVFYSNDIFTTFVFFELMSLASYPLVVHEENKEALNAGKTYLGVSIISGMILLTGIFFIYSEVGTLDFYSLKYYTKFYGLTPLMYVGGILMLLGFGAKAGMYPLHIWLPKAHPIAPAPSSALLSGILTKSGVFGIIVIASNIFYSNVSFGLILLILAVITMFLGALLALFSINLKRTLACSSMSQIGFILVGLSMMVLLKDEGGIANCGALLHMVNHSLIKLVLFMCAGVVAMNIHALDLNDIKGYGRKKIFLMIIFLIGSLAIMGIPGFSGYAFKTLIHESIVEYINIASSNVTFFKIIEYIFLISGGLTIAYMTKLFVCIFVEKNDDINKQKAFDNNTNYMSLLSKIIFGVSAVILLIIGIIPNVINTKIISSTYEFFHVYRFNSNVEFFSFENLKGSLISIGFGIIFYILVRLVFIKNKKYVNLWPNGLELEEIIYKPVLLKGTILITKYIVKFISNLFDKTMNFLQSTIFKPYVYQFEDNSTTHKFGEWLDYKTKSKGKFAKKLDSIEYAYIDKYTEKSNSFSFAFIMISFGIIIVLSVVFLLNLS